MIELLGILEPMCDGEVVHEIGSNNLISFSVDPRGREGSTADLRAPQRGRLLEWQRLLWLLYLIYIYIYILYGYIYCRGVDPNITFFVLMLTQTSHFSYLFLVGGRVGSVELVTKQTLIFSKSDGYHTTTGTQQVR